MQALEDRILYLGEATLRSRKFRFGIRCGDLRSHLALLGATGVGKTTLLRSLATQIIADARLGGCAVLDPHGDLVDSLWTAASDEQRKRVVFFDPADGKNPLGYNPLANIDPSRRSLAVSGLLSAFEKIWPEFWGPRTEHLLRHALLVLVDRPQSSLADVLRLFTDRKYAAASARQASNPRVRDFWLREWEGYGSRLRADASAPILNKVGAFVTTPALHRGLSGGLLSIDLPEIMDSGKILLINLSKGRLGSDASRMLGSLLIASLSTAGLARADQPEADRRDFALVVDEFGTLGTRAFAELFSELRKYRVSVIAAAQYLAQLDPLVQQALLSNVGSLVVFRVAAEDARLVAREFAPEFEEQDLQRMPNLHAAVRLMLRGQVSVPFSMRVAVSMAYPFGVG